MRPAPRTFRRAARYAAGHRWSSSPRGTSGRIETRPPKPVGSPQCWSWVWQPGIASRYFQRADVVSGRHTNARTPHPRRVACGTAPARGLLRSGAGPPRAADHLAVADHALADGVRDAGEGECGGLHPTVGRTNCRRCRRPGRPTTFRRLGPDCESCIAAADRVDERIRGWRTHRVGRLGDPEHRADRQVRELSFAPRSTRLRPASARPRTGSGRPSGAAASYGSSN